MRPITEIVIHCTATRPEFMADATTAQRVAEIRKWHVQGNGWSDIGYHHLIDRNGTVADGRPLERTGAHVRGHNTGTIGVSLFGGHGSSETDEFFENFTAAQNKVLREYIDDMRHRFPTITKISGHNEYAAKACPGFNVSDWLQDSFMPPDIDPDQVVSEEPVGGLSAILTAILSLFGKGKK